MFERLAGKILQRFLGKYFTTGEEVEEAEKEKEKEEGVDNGTANGTTPPTDNTRRASRTSANGSQSAPSPSKPTSNSNNNNSNTWTSMGVWSGYVSLQDLHLKTDVWNEKLASKGQPFEIVHGSIQSLELTIPWSKLSSLSTATSGASANSTGNGTSTPTGTPQKQGQQQKLDPSAAIVVVLDGVHLLIRTRFDFDDKALRNEQVQKRQKALQNATADPASASSSTSSSSWFKDILQQRLQQGILPQIANNLQIHIRNLHIRLEDIESDPANPFSCGIVLESMHVQHAEKEQSQQEQFLAPQQIPQQLFSSRTPTTGTRQSSFSNRNNAGNGTTPTIRKISQLNHFGIYWNALDAGDDNVDDGSVAPEHSILQLKSAKEIIWALDRGIARRSLARLSEAPKHAYLLVPVDATLQAEISSDPKQLQDQPIVSLVFSIPDLVFQVRDFQCLQVLLLKHTVEEHKYSKRYRPYRPTVSVHENPRAWWRYAEQVICSEINENRLRWSWKRFRQRSAIKQRYCELYERRLRAPSPDVAGGLPDPDSVEAASGLTDTEAIELQEIDDGLRGDLTVDDIILYRAVVKKRIGLQASTRYATTGRRSSWFRRSVHNMVADDEEAEEEYERLLAYLRQSSAPETNGSENNNVSNNRDAVAVSVQVHVATGHITYFSPLGSTADQKQLRRLQESFLDFTFSDFDVGVSLMGDFESLLVRVSVADFIAEELRSDRKKYTVITRAIRGIQDDPFAEQDIPPLLTFLLTKNPPSANDFRIGVQAQLYALELDLVPDCEWIGRLKLLIQPIPQLRKAAKFWGELNMASINTMFSDQLERILAKAQTAISEHKNMDIDVRVDCPLIRIADGKGSNLVIDLGRARLKTVKLAGVADTKLMVSVKAENDASEEVLKKQLLTGKANSLGGDSPHNTGPLPSSDSILNEGPPRSLEYTTPLDQSCRSTAGSVYLQGSARSLDYAQLDGEDYLSVNPHGPSELSNPVKNMEAFFYDVYELQVETGKLAIESDESETVSQTLSDGVAIRVALHKSIIPSDHTLCRLKAYCTVGKLMFSFSESRILHLGKFFETWVSVIASGVPLPTSPHTFRTKSRRVQVESLRETPFVKISDSASAIDENEFFDAPDHASYDSGDGSHLLDDNWVADTDSVIESETRSLNRSVTRRRRQRSVSDVSSISDSTPTRRRVQYQDNTYLSAENLVRLEETGEDSEDDPESDAGSFYSAITPGHLVALESELGINIEQAEGSIRILELKINDLKSNCGDNASADSNETLLLRRNVLRLEFQRSKAELKAMQAARFDLLAQIESSDKLQEIPSVSGATPAHSSRLARNAFLLIQSVKKRTKDPTGLEHSMTRDLKRDLVQCTVVFDDISIQLEDIDRSDSCGETDTIVVCITRSAGVFQQRVGEAKCHLSIDHLRVSLQHHSLLETQQHLLLVAGASESVPGGLLLSRFPQYISSTSADDKFVRGALEFRRAGLKGSNRTSPKFTKLRLVFGDVEFKPRVSSVKTVRAVISRVHRGLVGEGLPVRENAVRPEKNRGKEASDYFDVEVRIGSLRMLLDSNGDVTGALAVTEVGFRFVGVAKNHVHRDRAQIDARCGNIQVLCIDGYDSRRGFEVFGKRDLYAPLVRLRLKSQVVLEDETGGWVVGQKAVDSSDPMENAVPSKDTFVLNAHLGFKLDSLAVLASPDAIISLRGCIDNLRDAIKSSSSSLEAPETKTSDPRFSEQSTKAGLFGYPVRWRLDTSLKNSCIYLQGQDSKGHEPEHGKKVLVSLSLLASLQQSAHEDNGVLLQATLRGLSASRVSDEWPLLEPTVVTLRMVAPVRNRLCVPLKYPHLNLPDDPSWNDAETTPADGSLRDIGRAKPDVAASLFVSISPIKINIGVSLIVLMAETTAPLLSALKGEPKPGSEKLTAALQTPDRSRRWLQASLRVSVDQFRITILREGLNTINIATADPLASFSIVGLTGSSRSTPDSVKLSVTAAKAAVVDYTCRSGVQSFGSNDQQRSETQASTAVPDFVVVTCDITRFSDRINARLDMELGRIQVLLLPSLISSLITFQRAISESLPRSQKIPEPNEDAAPSNIQSMIRQMNKIDISVGMESVEFIFSAKDLPKYVRDSCKDSIGVVAFRLGLNAVGTLNAIELDKETNDSLNQLTLPGEDRQLLKEAFAKFLKGRVGRQGTSTAVSSNIELYVNDFQVLRTTIEKSEAAPHSFYLAPPSAGEHRITNSFSFGITQQLAGAWFPAPNKPDADSLFNLSQGIHVKAEFIDTLVYISPSDGGITDAWRVTVKPILEMLKKKDRVISGEENSSKKGDAVELFTRASTVCSIKADGFKFTCVPGGAAKVTEPTFIKYAPILKFAVLDFACGCAGVPVPGDVKLLSETSLESMAKVPGVTIQHFLVGGWLSCELSASYHNRRLVAWEPFIEPWTLETRLGVDLVRALKMRPLIDENRVQWKSLEQPMYSPFTSPLGSGGARLRDIGRLLRSPFRTDKSASPDHANLAISSILETDGDFCYLMLASAANEILSDALFQPSSATGRVPLSLLPGIYPTQWLGRFGFPFAKSTDVKDRTTPAVVCWISDATPLNINVTGALIESILEYRWKERGGKSRCVDPHWIRNETGLTLRFQEVLDNDRLQRGENSRMTTLTNGTEAPLSLKRSLSQSYDPHNAYIMVEFGSFEDTVGRVDQRTIPKGFRSSTFYYRTAAKIPVDTVGVHRYPLDLNLGKRHENQPSTHGSTSRSLGWVIVRVALHGGVKMVSIESPLVVKNISDSDILCEVRDHDGLSSLWRTLIPKVTVRGGFVPVPADLAPFIHEKEYIFSAIALSRESSFQHESELQSTDKGFGTRLSLRPPYSEAAFVRGLVDETVISVPVLKESSEKGDSVFLSVCSLRVGTFSLEHSTRLQQGSKSEAEVPEQRMLLFRSPLVVRNHLAVPVRVQARLKGPSKSSSERADPPDTSTEECQDPTDNSDWTDLGMLECGRDVSWTGAIPSEKVEIRIKLTGQDGGTSRQFPNWSTPVSLQSDHTSLRQATRSPGASSFSKLSKLKLFDSSKKALLVSLAMSRGAQPTESTSSFDNVQDLSRHMPSGSRVVSLYTPFWIVDGTGLDLQYRSGSSFIAGQVDAGVRLNKDKEMQWDTAGSTLGLGELLDDNDLLYLPSRLSFQVLMIGDETSTKLQVRRRLTRMHLSRESVSSWSDHIPLTSEERSHHDTAVMPPPHLLNTSGEERLGTSDVVEPFALRSRILRAPETLGGSFGTKLVHIVCRYAVVNELGLEIEIVGDHGQGAPVAISADGRARPFHFDDSGPVRFRPKEFGWQWSGRFQVKSNNREITLRLRHKVKGHTLLATVELQAKQVTGTCVLVFRPAAHAPYRIENHSMYPLQYRQISSPFRLNMLSRHGENHQDTVILPYHHADFAWDEPEFGRRSVAIQVADFGKLPNQMKNKVLGRFKLDWISPGTDLRLTSPLFLGQVIADGPTRVLRISEPPVPGAIMRSDGEQEEFQKRTKFQSGITTMLSVKLLHGLGISVVDWKPQELMYIRVENILLEQRSDGQKESGSASIGSIIVDNQLWVTPYPVMLQMGSRSARRRNRRNGAVSLLWRRSLNTCSGFSDLTLLEKVELSTEPSVISVDGNIGKLAIEMARHVKDLGKIGSADLGLLSRNKELKRVLDIVDIGNEADHSELEETQHSLFTNDLYAAVDYMATAAIASKLRSRYRPPNQGGATVGRSDNVSDPGFSRSLSKSRRKYYIEKLRISTTAAQVSWSGSLPIASFLPRLMRPALTFEGLPLFLRAFSSSHTYGTADEHLRSLKSHYISIWRIIDLLVGVLAKPTFLIRACISTSRESCSTAFSILSSSLHASECALLELISKSESAPNQTLSLPLFKTVVLPVISFNASVLRCFSKFTAAGSAMLSYDAASFRASGGLVRSRNPRLFANVDGKDLLVEYVEGENAGKALLSRVRMGAYLGEGYLYHIEGTHLHKETRHKWAYEEWESTQLIFMMTFERILLLNGQLNAKFCDVVWETSFSDLVHVEMSDESKDKHFGLILLWFLANRGHLTRNRDDRHANAITGDSTGLDTLHCKHIYVPKAIATVLLSKIASVDKSLLEQNVPPQ